MTLAATVFYPAERDLDAWRKRHASGEVPGAWPYGLEDMATAGVQVESGSLPPRTAVRRAIGAARGLVRRRGRASGTVGLTWDENSAHSLVRLQPQGRMYSGVIWLTDSLVSRPDADYNSLIGSLRQLNGVWVLSRAQVEPLQEVLGEDAPPVHYVRFGVDARFFAARPYPSVPLVLSIGGDRHRDPGTLFAALGLVHEEHPEAEILVQSSSDLPVPPGVTKIAHVSHRELRDLYARASVIAIATSPNLHGSGMTVSLEAMATARPVVLTATPGMEDYVADGVTGYLAVPGASESLAAPISRLLADPRAAARMGLAGRSAVERDMTSGHLAARLRSVIL